MVYKKVTMIKGLTIQKMKWVDEIKEQIRMIKGLTIQKMKWVDEIKEPASLHPCIKIKAN
jgi:hypothetical protein